MTPVDEQVVTLLVEHLDVRRTDLQPSTRLVTDLGMDGDDAVEFFETFQQRFAVDLAPLYRNWPSHFGQEGWGWADTRLNWAIIAALGMIAADIVLRSGWVSLIGFIALLATTCVGFLTRKTWPQVPVTVEDLFKAAATKRWPLSYPER